jgi:hypothetical protein
MPSISDLYKIAITADEVFGAQACNARYDERGRSTPKLKVLSNAKQEADIELHNAFVALR